MIPFKIKNRINKMLLINNNNNQYLVIIVIIIHKVRIEVNNKGRVNFILTAKYLVVLIL